MSGHSESDSDAVVEVPLTASISFPVPWLAGIKKISELLLFWFDSIEQFFPTNLGSSHSQPRRSIWTRLWPSNPMQWSLRQLPADPRRRHLQGGVSWFWDIMVVWFNVFGWSLKFVFIEFYIIISGAQVHGNASSSSTNALPPRFAAEDSSGDKSNSPGDDDVDAKKEKKEKKPKTKAKAKDSAKEKKRWSQAKKNLKKMNHPKMMIITLLMMVMRRMMVMMVRLMDLNVHQRRQRRAKKYHLRWRNHHRRSKLRKNHPLLLMLWRRREVVNLEIGKKHVPSNTAQIIKSDSLRTSLMLCHFVVLIIFSVLDTNE